MSISKADLTEFLQGAAVFGLFIGGCFLLSLLFGSSASNQNTTVDKDEIISQAQDDIDEQYGDLRDEGQTLTSDIDNECVWLMDNISTDVGDYCNDNANSYYADINGDNWSATDISYDDTQPLTDIIDTIIGEANEQYNDLLSKVQETEDAMQEECGWLGENISRTVGDYCDDSYERASIGHSSDPFDASDYYDDSAQ
jgi:hypothetical protein